MVMRSKTGPVSTWMATCAFVASNLPGEYYSFNLPFRFQGSPEVLVEDGIGYHRIPEDYLPGARTDAAVPQHSLVLVGQSEGRTIT
jgi:hypothetical protein